MNITKTCLPQNSILKVNGIIYDYTDSFRGTFTDKFQNIDVTEIAGLFFKTSPQWIQFLFALRNKIVGVFGLKISKQDKETQKSLTNLKLNTGDSIGLFKVFNKTANEVVLGEDDKHLNFRVSLLIDDLPNTSNHKNLTISTTVKYNNWLGRLYFFPVSLFHKIIVPAMLKAIIRNIENRNTA